MHWREAGDAEGIEIELDAVDGERLEAAEIARFVRMSRGDLEDKHGALGRTGEVARTAAAAILFTLALLVGPILLWLAFATAPLWGLAAVVLAGIVALTRRILRRLHRDKVDDASASTSGARAERFTLSLDRCGFALTGADRPELRVPLEDVQAFDLAGRRVALVRADGASVVLPCDLGTNLDNAALATRLREALIAVRANTYGYRGPRVDTSGESASRLDEDERDDGDAGVPDALRRKE